MKKIVCAVSFLMVFIFFCHGRVSAQNIQPGQEPGAEAQRYRDDVIRTKKALEYKKPKAPSIEVEKERAAAVSVGASFVLRDVNVTGSTVFNAQDFKSAYDDYLGKEVTFEDMDGISKKIESMYDKQGYLSTVVYIPQQEIRDGVIEIRVVEGRMGHLSVEGNKWFSSSLIKKFIHSKKNEILNIKTLVRDLLRLNKKPDLAIRVVIEPGKETQTSDITLKVIDHFPWHLGLLQDNRGSRLTGRYRSMLYERCSNLSGIGDTIFLNTLYSGKSFGQSLSYAIPLGSYGTKFAIDTTYFIMKIGREYKMSDITGNTQIYSPHFSWELALTEEFEAYLDLGIDIKSIKQKTSGELTSDDQLRTPYFSFNLIKADFKGQTTLSSKFNFGTSGFLGSSHRKHPSASRAGTGGFFFKYEQSLNRVQKIFLNSYFSIGAQFQLASHTLASSEEFQLGGADSVRGYPEGDYLADYGGVLNMNYFFPLYVIPQNWTLAGQDVPLRRQIEGVLFVDVGGGKLKKTLQGERKDKFLAGIGGGLRFNFKHFSLRLDWAKAVGDRPSSGFGPSTFYFSFQSEM